MKELPEDSELVEKLRKGDVTAFDGIYSRYAGRLYSFGLKYLRSKTEAEELVQSVFMKIWENSGNLRKESSFKSYLFTIAYNDICKLFRKRNYHEEFLREAIRDKSMYSSQDEEGIDYGSVLEQVGKIVEKMPERQKQIFLMSRNEGKSTAEIAKELGLTTGTIDNYISDALKYIRSRLKPENLTLLLSFYLFLA